MSLRHRVRKWLLPAHVYDPLRFEFGLLSVRMNAPRERARFRDQRDLLVNLGCGGRALPGFVNVDAAPNPGVDCVWDCRASLPFADQSVRGIFSEHFFEHVSYEDEAPALLRECRRVLQPGGVLRLIVPDAGRYLHAYARGSWDELAALRRLDSEHVDPWFQTRYSTPMELINAVFRQGTQHKFAYDADTLSHLLARHDLRPSVCAFGRSQLPALVADSPDRESESLYVEGVR
jgi:predicted SAM-dependent methyltransferase